MTVGLVPLATALRLCERLGQHGTLVLIVYECEETCVCVKHPLLQRDNMPMRGLVPRG